MSPEQIEHEERTQQLRQEILSIYRRGMEEAEKPLKEARNVVAIGALGSMVFGAASLMYHEPALVILAVVCSVVLPFNWKKMKEKEAEVEVVQQQLINTFNENNHPDGTPRVWKTWEQLINKEE